MKMSDFIEQNRKEIDKCILRVLTPEQYIATDEERELWVMNDERLYIWAMEYVEGLND